MIVLCPIKSCPIKSDSNQKIHFQILLYPSYIGNHNITISSSSSFIISLSCAIFHSLVCVPIFSLHSIVVVLINTPFSYLNYLCKYSSYSCFFDNISEKCYLETFSNLKLKLCSLGDKCWRRCLGQVVQLVKSVLTQYDNNNDSK